MRDRVKGRTALVTGSTNGIGRATAMALAAEGAQVIVTGRNVERGAGVVAEIVEDGGLADFVAADLSGGTGEVSRLAADATALAGGHLDILVNNAAVLVAPGPTADVDPELLHQALGVSIGATFQLTGAVASAMATRGQGVVVNIGSIIALRGGAGSALYGMTKAAVHSLSMSWAAEYGPSGVRVNTVAPGPTLTEWLRPHADVVESLVGRLPSGRASTTAEVAAAVLFLASDDAANITGATLSVDGGWSAV